MAKGSTQYYREALISDHKGSWYQAIGNEARKTGMFLKSDDQGLETVIKKGSDRWR